MAKLNHEVLPLRNRIPLLLFYQYHSYTKTKSPLQAAVVADQQNQLPFLAARKGR
jgi:hypothetical protein